jgi:hypothetical protein
VTTTRDEDLFAPVLELIEDDGALLTGASAFGAGVEVMAVTLLPLVPGTGGIVIFSEALDDAMLVATEFLAGAFLATFLAATFLAGAFFATFLAVTFLAEAFLATFLAVTFLAGAFLATFFAAIFFAATFFAGAFLATFFAVFFTATVVLLINSQYLVLLGY